MADKVEKVRYPQIPTTVWWGVRAILNRTPNTTLDERTLAIQLKVQEAAAKQYIGELIQVGILDEDKRATPLALRWRLDTTYPEAVSEILRNVYPEALIDLAPPDDGDRQKAVSWFLHEGLGQGAAGNKASTYFMIGSPAPNESPIRKDEKLKKPAGNREASAVSRQAFTQKGEKAGKGRDRTGTDGIPLNVNVQSHISADASSEQIESIFAAMRRYLYDQQAG